MGSNDFWRKDRVIIEIGEFQFNMEKNWANFTFGLLMKKMVLSLDTCRKLWEIHIICNVPVIMYVHLTGGIQSNIFFYPLPPLNSTHAKKLGCEFIAPLFCQYENCDFSRWIMEILGKNEIVHFVTLKMCWSDNIICGQLFECSSADF